MLSPPPPPALDPTRSAEATCPSESAPSSEAAWRRIVDDLAAVDQVILADTIAGTGLLGVQADLLVRLGQIPDHRSPMNALAAELRISGSSLTKVVDRLTDLGLTGRDASVVDRRVVHVVLTDAGVELAARLRQRWVRTIRRRVVDVLGPGEDIGTIVGVARHLT